MRVIKKCMSRIVSGLFIFILFAGLLLSGPNNCVAQTATDTTQTSGADTTLKKGIAPGAMRKPAVNTFIDDDSLAFALKPHPFQPNPKKAGLYAAILPGLGQTYNRQYWKIPIVYAGLGTAVYFVSKNLKNYQSYRKSYIGLLSNPNYTDDNVKKYPSSTDLKQLQDQYEKNLNLSGLLTTVGYFLQVLDAITSAHLKNFDMSRDISMRFEPVAMPNNGLGLGLVMNFK